MRRLFTVFLMLLLCCLLPFEAEAKANHGRKQVLYLNSYQNGYRWSDNILQGIRATFRGSGYLVDLQVEYMDAKKHPGAENQAILKRLFKSKFSQTRFDAIISSDNDAFQFLLAHRDELFPGVPVVFCGVNDLRPELLAGQQDFSGVVEELDIRYNLELALRLNPDKKQVVVVSDSSVSSTAIAAQVKEAMPDFTDRLEFRFWQDVPLKELLRRSRSMPDDSVLFFIPFYVETEGSYLSAGEVVEALYDNANVPIYGAWTFLLGHGIVGGRLLDGVSQGRTAASMVVDILEGRSVPAILSGAEAESPLRFDWKVLEKFGLTGASFPEDVEFINRPVSTYELGKRVVWTVIILFSVLGVFTVMMTASRHRAVRAEQELALSRKTLRSIIDTIPQLIYWKDRNSRYMGANKRFTDFFGLDEPDEVEGKENRDLFQEEGFSRTGEILDRKVMEENLSLLHETYNYEAPGRDEVVFEISKVPLHDDDGNITGVLTTAEDVTERINLERQLLQSQKLEAVGTFVGGIAHDFNNLLTTVINSTELALMDAKGVVAEDVRRAKAAAEHGSQLVKQILTFARPSNKGATLVDPSVSVNEALDLMEPRLPSSITLLRDVPAQAGKGLADPAHLQQIVMNLCTNSLHAMQEIGGEIEVRLRVEQSGDERQLHLMVHDTGPGIPPEAMERIFDPFYTTKDKDKGTGLGLAIVQGVVHGHGGQIKLTSQPGDTSFDIRIPFADSTDSIHEIAATPQEGTERILFVEDDEDQLALVPRSLARLGYSVTPAQGGQQALDIIMSGKQVDVVVTDFDMPGLNGVELARTLLQLQPDLKVILVSGGKEAAAAAHGERGIAKIVLKPYTGPSLAAAIRQTMDAETS